MNNGNNLSSETKDKKIRIIILAVTLGLTAIFIVAAILTSVFSYDHYYDDNNNNSHSVSGRLYIGSNSIYVGNDGVYYSFTPNNSGLYTFSSSGSADPEAVLYDSNWSQLTSNDDYGGNSNFRLSYNMYSGRTYYLKISLHSGYGYVTVNVLYA